MSIDAIVVGICYDDKTCESGKLLLEARRPKSGPAGQSVLGFLSAPKWVNELIGQEVWGGSGEIMWKEQKIATRIGYTSIRFVFEPLNGLGPKRAVEAGK